MLKMLIHDRYETDLQQGRRVRVPLFLGTPVPRVQDGEADLAVVVQVRVEPNSVVARRLQVDLHRRVRVVQREEDVKLEDAVGVRRVVRAGDQHLERRKKKNVTPV